MSNEPVSINIEYSRPKLSRRIFANLLDFLILALLTVALFIPTRAIVQSTKTYKDAEEVINTERIASGLYVNDGDEIVSIVDSVDNDVSLSSSEKINAISNSITYFINDYMSAISNEKVANIVSEYHDYLVDSDKSFDGQPYFIDSSGTAIRNSSCTADNAKYFTNIYRPFVEQNLEAHLLNDVPNVRKSILIQSNFLIFLELPVSYLLAAFITFILPTLIFKRNRSTLGRLAYRIGLVDKDMLSVKPKTLLAKNLFFYFFEAILSMLTFGLPLIITFSMMAFSKNGQGFADYMTGIQEIDLNSGKIFFSKEEAIINQIQENKKPVNFK